MRTPATPPSAADASALLSACLARARDRMEDAGADSPWLTALVLLEHATGFGREQVLAHPERVLTAAQGARFRALVARRCRREPLAYIVGSRDFYGRRFIVTPDTLIPRPETEGLVDLALDRMDRWISMDAAAHPEPVEGRTSTSARTTGADAVRTFVDVGTGSGAIAVTLLAERRDWRGVATDTSEGALALAARNAAQHEVASRLRLIECDLATAIGCAAPLVVANLPYVPTGEIDELEPEVSRFEPRSALDGGPDGTDVVRSLLSSLPDLLLPGGSAILEIGEGQGSGLRAFARDVLPHGSVSVERDAAGLERYLVVDRGA